MVDMGLTAEAVAGATPRAVGLANRLAADGAAVEVVLAEALPTHHTVPGMDATDGGPAGITGGQVVAALPPSILAGRAEV